MLDAQPQVLQSAYRTEPREEEGDEREEEKEGSCRSLPVLQLQLLWRRPRLIWPATSRDARVTPSMNLVLIARSVFYMFQGPAQSATDEYF
jgi:hypothetical protein